MLSYFWQLSPKSFMYIVRAMHMKRRDAYMHCYQILGVKDTDDQNTVRNAYISLVKRVHPDSGTEEACSERFQQVDEAFKILQEKFAKSRRNILEDEEEAMEFDIRHTAPQHRQYLSYGGIGVGNPFQRQKQYQQVKAVKAQEAVLKHRIDKSTAGEKTLMPKSGKSGNYYGKHAIKTKYGIDRIVEDLIQESMSRGDFQNLKGSGKPLSSAQSQNPYLDFTTHKLNKIMLDNGFTPEWITLNRDIREGVAALKESIRAERIYYDEYPLSAAQAEEWCEFLKTCEAEVKQLNKLIDKYNLIVPILENQFFRLHLHKIGDNILKDKNLQRNVKRNRIHAVTQAQNAATPQDYSTNIFSLLTNLFRV